MSLAFLGFTFDVMGKLMIAYVTLRIHIKHFQKHKINKGDIRLDIQLSIIGIALIAIGYVLRAPFEWSSTM